MAGKFLSFICERDISETILRGIRGTIYFRRNPVAVVERCFSHSKRIGIECRRRVNACNGIFLLDRHRSRHALFG